MLSGECVFLMESITVHRVFCCPSSRWHCCYVYKSNYCQSILENITKRYWKIWRYVQTNQRQVRSQNIKNRKPKNVLIYVFYFNGTNYGYHKIRIFCTPCVHGTAVLQIKKFQLNQTLLFRPLTTYVCYYLVTTIQFVNFN